MLCILYYTLLILFKLSNYTILHYLILYNVVSMSMFGLCLGALAGSHPGLQLSNLNSRALVITTLNP